MLLFHHRHKKKLPSSATTFPHNCFGVAVDVHASARAIPWKIHHFPSQTGKHLGTGGSEINHDDTSMLMGVGTVSYTRVVRNVQCFNKYCFEVLRNSEGRQPTSLPSVPSKKYTHVASSAPCRDVHRLALIGFSDSSTAPSQDAIPEKKSCFLLPPYDCPRAVPLITHPFSFASWFVTPL